MSDQLRQYQIAPGRMEDFIDACRQSEVLKLRERFGFEFVAAWVIEDENKFVWVVRHPGDDGDFKAAEEAYYASSERATLTPDSGEFVLEATTVLMTTVHI